MSTKIFVNLPVANLPKSTDFYKALGFSLNPQFCDETAVCVVISEHIHVMLLTHEKFAQFTTKAIGDATKVALALLSLTRESRSDVDAIVAKAIAAGGSSSPEPRLWLYVFPRLSGPRRPRLGSVLHGARRASKIVEKANRKKRRSRDTRNRYSPACACS